MPCYYKVYCPDSRLLLPVLWLGVQRHPAGRGPGPYASSRGVALPRYCNQSIRLRQAVLPAGTAFGGGRCLGEAGALKQLGSLPYHFLQSYMSGKICQKKCVCRDIACNEKQAMQSAMVGWHEVHCNICWPIKDAWASTLRRPSCPYIFRVKAQDNAPGSCA